MRQKDQSDSSLVTLRFMQKRVKELAELRKSGKEVLDDPKLSDDQKREQFLQIHLKMTEMAREANAVAKIGRKHTDESIKDRWKAIHNKFGGQIIYSAATDAEKDKVTELDKARIRATASTLSEATELLQWHYAYDKGKDGKPLTNEYGDPKGFYGKSYSDRLKVLRELYGK